MRRVENSPLAIFEDAEKQADAHRDVRDVRHRDEHVSLRRQRLPDALQQRTRIAQVFEDVGQNDCIGMIRKAAHVLQIGDDHLIESSVQIADAVDIVFEADRPFGARDSG